MLKIFVGIGLLALLFGCQEGGKEPVKESGTDWQKSSVLPVKPGATVQIRVVNANNPRLPRFTPEQMKVVLASAQLAVWKNFGVYVEFTEAPDMNIGQLFALIPADIMKERLSSIYDFKSGKGDRQLLAEGIHTTLTQRGTKLEDALAFAAPYLPADAHPKDLPSLSDLLAKVMLERMEDWRNLKAADGNAVLDASPYNEWVYWDTLGYGNLPYDLVITNQFIASAEYYGVDIHSALRGGVTVGTTAYSRSSKFGSYVFWSTFPFQDDSATTKLMRGGEEYSTADAAELSGAYLAHEIGHLLLQLGHPFGQKACAMNPVSMLRFREWFTQVNGTECPIGSRPEMKEGAIPPVFNASWVRATQAK